MYRLVDVRQCQRFGGYIVNLREGARFRGPTTMRKSGVLSSGLTLRCDGVVRVADRGKDRRHGLDLHSSDQFAKFGGLS